MQEGFIEVNSVPTHIFTWGKWIHDDFDEDIKELVLVIPGNPGLGGFYTLFCSTLFDETDKKIPIWLIGHAGHDDPKEELKMLVPALESNGDLYNLQGQVNHKLDFIRKYVPSHVKIHLISHSIGSKISLDLLKDKEVSEKVQHAYLLFPTIERMVNSPLGFLWYKVIRRIHFLMRLFYYACSYLPLIARTILLYAVCLLLGWPKFFLGTLIKASAPEVLDKVWFLFLDEMEKVCEIDEEIIKKNKDRLKFYYGTTDGWVPVKYFQQLVERFPGIDAELCTQKVDHGFVVSHGPRMGRMVSDWIKQRSFAFQL